VLAWKRIVAVIAAVPLALALNACARPGTGDGYDTTNASPEASLDPASAPELAAPVGIPTDKLVAATLPQMGSVVTDANGWVLYRFDKDTASATASACNGQCATVWPPVLTDGNPTLQGIRADLVGTVVRDDGASQVTLGGWPLYRYVGDTTPGTWKGQMVNGTWFVSAPDGKKNITCLPTATPTAAAPPPPSGAPAAGY
jgi:predicted lipoprotein with Yx(FWY)xxD motif